MQVGENVVLLSDHMWFAIMNAEQARRFVLAHNWNVNVKDRYGIYIDCTTGEHKVIRL